MTYACPSLNADLQTIPRMAPWITRARVKTPEDAAFLSGAALSHLHMVLRRDEVPQALLRDRLALRAAEACTAISGRSERASELRDAVHLLRPGDQPGPAGEILLSWRYAAERPVSAGALQRALPACAPEQIAAWLDAGQGPPIQQAAGVLEAVLTEAPRAETDALVLGDAALAPALGWDHMVPLLAAGLKPRDLRKAGEELRLAVHRALLLSAVEAARMAADLARRSANLKTAAAKLRARGAGEAVRVFLTRDAVAPAALTGAASGAGMSGRAARRLCSRLVELGVVRELTGRGTFRLYGV